MQAEALLEGSIEGNETRPALGRNQPPELINVPSRLLRFMGLAASSRTPLCRQRLGSTFGIQRGQQFCDYLIDFGLKNRHSPGQPTKGGGGGCSD